MPTITRRTWLRTLAATPLALRAAGVRAAARQSAAEPFGAGTLPAGIRSRIVAGVNGIAMHVLEAGFEAPDRPGLLLVHGFPELGYSWRKVMPTLAEAGYHVMAPDQRGYGRSGGTDVRFDDDLAPFSTLEPRTRHAGADLGARPPHARWRRRSRLRIAGGRLVRADASRRVPSVVMMSAPFAGAARLPFNTANEPAAAAGTGLRHGRRARQALAAAQALSDLLHDARGQREHVACRAGPPRLPARLLSRQERRLAERTSRIRWRRTPPQSSRSCRATT